MEAAALLHLLRNDNQIPSYYTRLTVREKLASTQITNQSGIIITYGHLIGLLFICARRTFCVLATRTLFVLNLPNYYKCYNYTNKYIHSYIRIYV